MISNLEQKRRAYRSARSWLGWCNQNNWSQRADAMAMMNRARNELAKELNRVRWLVWPNTGRPATKWQVVSRSLPHVAIITSTFAECFNICSLSKHKNFFIRPVKGS